MKRGDNVLGEGEPMELPDEDYAPTLDLTEAKETEAGW